MNITLSNGVEMPLLIQGLPLLRDYSNKSLRFFQEVIIQSINLGIYHFDTSHDYGNSEVYLGKCIQAATKSGLIERKNIFVTTKIGNSQQINGDIECAVECALKKLNLDYIDMMLLHWPYPEYYIANWRKLEKIYESGKVKAIGIANIRERHLIPLLQMDIKPHVVQFEYHPFRTVPELVSLCKKNNIAIQAYSSLVQMIPLVTKNKLLLELAHKYCKTVPQLIIKWDIQQKIAPIFRTYNKTHLAEFGDLDFHIDENDLNLISSLNIDYKLHPESMNCPGF